MTKPKLVKPMDVTDFQSQGRRFITRPMDLFYIEAVEDKVLKHFAELISASGRILDIGCGFGEKTESFRRLGMDAYGIDVDPARISLAVRQFPDCKFCVNSIEHLSFENNFFDAIFSCSTLQYVDLEEGLNEIVRVLKPGGKAVFIENLAHHPLVVGFRTIQRVLRRPYSKYLTPRAHLDWTKVQHLKRIFTNVEYVPYNLTTTLALAVSTVRQINKRTEIIQPKSVSLYNHLARLDSLILTRVPFTRRYCWTLLVMAIK